MRIKIRPNSRKPWAVALRREVGTWLRARNHRIVANRADATICIGGDGTIYYASFMKALEGRVIGIGSRTSFVCQLKKEDWKRGLLARLQSRGTRRTTLETTWKGRTWHALADFVLHSRDYRVVWIFLEAGGRVYRFEGDGIVIATATGSSGYAYSAGGPQLKSDSRDILVVPICPYRRTFKPLRLERRSMEKIRVWSDRETALIADGRLIGKLKKGEKLLIHRGREAVFA